MEGAYGLVGREEMKMLMGDQRHLARQRRRSL